MSVEMHVEKRAREERAGCATAWSVRTIGRQNGCQEAQNSPDSAFQLRGISRDWEGLTSATNLPAMRPAPLCAGSCDGSGLEASMP